VYLPQCPITLYKRGEYTMTEVIDHPEHVDRQADYGGLVQQYWEIPEEVLNTLVMVKAWHLLDVTYDEGYYDRCTYCTEMLDGEDEFSVPVCEHYLYLTETIFPATWALWDALGDRAWWKLEHCGPSYLHEPDWTKLPEGYYAVPDPRGIQEMTYWRRKNHKKRGQSFGPWPTKARYGWVLLRSDIPEDLPPEISRDTYVRAYYETLATPYRQAIVEAIEEDPVAAQHRFADFNTRCCYCGKRLTNDLSKVYGIGPECRKGLSPEVLANYYRPEVGKAHAEHH
jgi:hypothetical protein